jgi:hypothetical protein
MKAPTKRESSIEMESELEQNLALMERARNTSIPASVEGNLALINRVSERDLDKFDHLSNIGNL